MERTIYKPSTSLYDERNSVSSALEKYDEYISILSDEDLKSEYKNAVNWSNACHKNDPRAVFRPFTLALLALSMAPPFLYDLPININLCFQAGRGDAPL